MTAYGRTSSWRTRKTFYTHIKNKILVRDKLGLSPCTPMHVAMHSRGRSLKYIAYCERCSYKRANDPIAARMFRLAQRDETQDSYEWQRRVMEKP